MVCLDSESYFARESEGSCRVGCSAELSGWSSPAFQRSFLPPQSERSPPWSPCVGGSRSSETPANFNQTARRYSWGDGHLRTLSRENSHPTKQRCLQHLFDSHVQKHPEYFCGLWFCICFNYQDTWGWGIHPGHSDGSRRVIHGSREQPWTLLYLEPYRRGRRGTHQTQPQTQNRGSPAMCSEVQVQSRFNVSNSACVHASEYSGVFWLYVSHGQRLGDILIAVKASRFTLCLVMDGWFLLYLSLCPIAESTYLDIILRHQKLKLYCYRPLFSWTCNSVIAVLWGQVTFEMVFHF